MKIRKVIPFLLAFIILLPCLTMAADQEEPVIYTIKRGDTLWGLSERFIKDPNYWPNMWSKNDVITNPHVIYPGQKVRVFSDHLEFEPKAGTGKQAAVTAPAAAKAADMLQDVAEERVFTIRGSEGYLLEKDSRPAGYVIGTHNDRIVTGMDDIVYTDIGANNGARGGEKFSIFHDEGTVSHPVTNENMGKKIIPLGSLQLTDVEQKASRAIITKNYKEISPGSYLMPYRNGRSHEVTLKMTSRDLKGYIIESYSGTQCIAAGDIVYIDLGSNQGAVPGNMLYIVRDVTLDKSITQGRVERLPQELLGALVILETGKKTATALVVKSIDAIYRGDKLISQTK
ncbi:MAG: LysM peptidoglycan-binding domain-containing protein [Desulfuromonadales bacterium]|nr:LysM peptidoglycan-binding domain-containing protein [Desulfuromonadales bacterium]